MKLPEGIVVFTDGASRGNPGPGGWGFALIDTQSEAVFEGAGFNSKTTNNNMELTAVVEALKFAHSKQIEKLTLYTDSAYVAQGMTIWIFGWIKNGWKTKTKTDVLNADEWKECASLLKKVKVTVHRVSGHAGVPVNERVDKLATLAADTKKHFSKRYSFADYVKHVEDFLLVPTDIRPAKPSKDSAQKKVAYSYVSMVDGKIMTHKTWDETKARVHGKKAKYKKAFSADEEKSIMNEFQGKP